jgi:hypothetical protein
VESRQVGIQNFSIGSGIGKTNARIAGRGQPMVGESIQITLIDAAYAGDWVRSGQIALTTLGRKVIGVSSCITTKPNDNSCLASP